MKVIKVYKYGALKPTKGFDLVMEQLKLANRYQNKLLEIELWRRAAKHFDCDPEEIKSNKNEAIRCARSVSGLGWGTYQAIEQASQASCKRLQDVFFSDKLDIKKSLSRFRPRFKRYDGTGTVAATLQRCSKNVDNSVKIIDSGRKSVINFRVIGDKWIEVPIVLHRKVPDDAKIIMASLHIDRIGNRWVYSVILSLDLTDVKTNASIKSPGRGDCAINFGWRVTDDGIRVATVSGDHGEEHLVIPNHLIDKRKHAESLGSLADKNADKFLGDSRLRSKTRKNALENKGPSDLSFIRFDAESSDKNNPAHVEHWARRDRHLYQWQQDENHKMMNARKEIYRLWARKLHSKYENVVIEDFDLNRVIKRDQQVEIPQSRHVRFLVAPSFLRLEIKSVFGENANLVKSKNMTKKCHSCKKKCTFEAAHVIDHICEHCGASWDQDVNNARNQWLDTAAE